MTAPFVGDDFLLTSPIAAALYHDVARDLPIIDYHCHLSPALMAADHRFGSISEIWLDGDHYKWRAMRANGVPERLCTGDASAWEKFEAWAATVPATIGNPLHHWTAMELRRPFGIDTLLSPRTARDIFARTNERLAEPGFTVMGLLRQFRVGVVCTTDDPADTLDAHRQLAARTDPDTRVYPTWRPDRAFDVSDPAGWNAYIDTLAATARIDIGSWESLLRAFQARHDAFHELGCRASDHGLAQLDGLAANDAEASACFDRLRGGHPLDASQAAVFRSTLLHRLAVLDHARGWVQQFHLGAMRNNNTRMRRALGPDTGYDAMGDLPQGAPLARFLDGLDQSNQLAKTIIYNVNPADNAMFASLIGCFQDGLVPGKMQWGSAWWFLDQLDGMEAQLRTLANIGLLARFVGMTTDSRSFLSYVRHDYFRRLVCQMLGDDVARGRVPDDRELLGQLVADVCFFNARAYFGFVEGRLSSGVERAQFAVR